MPASAITRPEPAMVTMAASFWLRSALAVRSANSRVFLGAHGGRELADRAAGVAGGGLAQQRDRASGCRSA